MLWRKRLYTNLIVFSGLLTQSLLFAQPTHIQLKQLSTDQGLSSSTIISTMQDHNGFMWVGTTEGLNRYDGSGFKVYKHNRSNPASLPDNFVVSMLLDKDKIYVGTNAGISLYNPVTDGFINFNKDSSSCLFNHTFQIRAIVKGPKESLFIATSIGLVIFNPKDNTFEQIAIQRNSAQTFTDIRINSLCIIDPDKLLLGTTSGLWLYNSKTKKLQVLGKNTTGEDYSDIRVNKIIRDKTEKIWLTSYYRGLFSVEKTTNGEFSLHPYLNSNSISQNRFLSLTVDQKNNLWIGAENDGLFVLNQEKKEFSHFLSIDSDPLYTTTYSVENLCFDNSGNLWIGTFAHGIQIHAQNSDAIVSYSKFKGGDLGVTNNMVNAFTEDRDGNIWVGTDGGGVHVLNKKTNWFTSYNTKNSKIQSDYILSMTDDGDKIWMTTWGNGLLCYNKKQEIFTSYNAKNSKIPDNDIFNITKGINNDFWMGSYNNGLVHFFPDENRFINYTTDNSNIGDNYVNVVRHGAKGNLFIGTRSGMVSFNTEKEEFKAYSLLNVDAKTLSNLHVYDIFYENDTSVWAATLSGLNRINPKTGKNTKFTVKNGLPSNNVRGVLKDELGNLWIATTKGVCCFDKNNELSRLFTKADGLQSDEIRPRSVLKANNGNLYFGGVNGFNIIHPEKIVTNSKIPEVLITGLDIFNEPVIPNTKGSPLERMISDIDELQLPYDQTVLTFYFAVLDYTRPEKNQHAYMLENFDKDWIYCGSRREVTYTNLDPGTYTLRVKGSNNDGLWNEKGVSLKVIIVPPWWATWWFKSLIVFGLLSIAIVIYYLRVSALKRQRNKLEIIVAERTKQLAEINATKDKLFSIIAHDLRNPFNVILGFTDLLLENLNKFDKNKIHGILSDLKMSGENAFSLLENLLNWSYSQRNQIEFNPINISTELLFNRVISELQTVSNKKNITLINNQTTNFARVYADFDMLLLVLRNLITNAIKFSAPHTEIWLNANVHENGWVTISVTDQGIGIEQDKIETLFELKESNSSVGTHGEKGTGLGLIISKEFIKKHKGRIWIESKPGKGSTFNFTIPETAEVYQNN